MGSRWPAVDFTECVRDLVYRPSAERIGWTATASRPTPRVRSKSLPLDEARLILMRLEFHYGLMHDNRVNMVEIGNGMAVEQCLDCRAELKTSSPRSLNGNAAGTLKAPAIIDSSRRALSPEARTVLPTELDARSSRASVDEFSVATHFTNQLYLP
jgi:hypothetical protein